ncbi:hypothetical protein SAMN04489707_105214 [Paenacidovorax caeni]|uniref:Uncharacterized protein n=1 Tax=Paenacidovorax caeni TaxID=343013 RepID=A0A1I7KI48_9BURK|nr:hypothetical protein SAMN04489707_105214 [Paenacidovorax caeni]
MTKTQQNYLSFLAAVVHLLQQTKKRVGRESCEILKKNA